MKNYNITNNLSFVKDHSTKRYEGEKKIDQHVQAGDYFGTTATVVDLCAQIIAKNNDKSSSIHKAHLESQLKHLRDEFLYIHNNFELKEKE